MATNIDFSNHYKTHIQPHVAEYELKRVVALKNRKLCFIVACILVLFAAATIYYSRQYYDLSEDAQGWVDGIVAIIALGACCGTTMPARFYKSDVKQNIFPRIFDFIDANYKQYKFNYKVKDKLSNSLIIPNHDSSLSEDFISSEYKDVSINIFETKLTKRRGKRTKTIFKGIFITLDMNKNFLGTTILKKDAGKIGNWISNKLSSLERAKLEDPVFEKQFEVYTNDQVEARFILTPDLMERIASLSNMFDGAKVQASFYNNKLLLMVPTKKNMFEPQSIGKPVSFKEDIEMLMAEMAIIHEIVDLLELYKR